MPTFSDSPTPFFSIIIPVCRTEQFLEQCLGSLLAQTFADFECLVVNDGSAGVDLSEFSRNQDENWQHEFVPKNTPQPQQCNYIFDQVVGRDSRFKLVVQKNAGASKARNTGLDGATGKYVVFLDSDDWVEPEHLTNFYSQIQIHQPNSLIGFAPTEYYNTGRKIPQFIPKKITLAGSLHRNIFILWNAVWDRQIIERYSLRMDERLGRGPNFPGKITNIAEDNFFAFQYMESLISQFGSFKVNFIKNTYKYREVQKQVKDSVDAESFYHFSKFLADYCRKYKQPDIFLASKILPHWAGLATTSNPLVLVYRKALTLLLRLITRCYF